MISSASAAWSVSIPEAAKVARRVEDVGGADERAESAGSELRLAQLLCSRLCHDLIGAAGAISTGVELLADGAADSDDIHDLLGLSGRQLSRRLSFYRHAFAMNGRPEAVASLTEARRLTADLLADTRIMFAWKDDRAPSAAGNDLVAADLVRSLLCAVLIVVDGLPRGGRIEIGIPGGEAAPMLNVEGTGRDAALPPPLLAALAAPASSEAPTARTVTAHYLLRLAREIGGRVAVTPVDTGFAVGIAAERG